VRALGHVLRHNTWATGTIIDFCRARGPAVLELTAPGTFGTVYGALQHVVGGEQWYVWLLTREIVGPRVRRDERHTLDELASVAVAIGERELRIASDDDADRPVVMNEGRNSTVGVVLAQLVHHGNEHRTQVTTILGANGIDPPPISAWGYGRAVGISQAEE
jgi:uncharacterized damage-inducible protein DinB